MSSYPAEPWQESEWQESGEVFCADNLFPRPNEGGFFQADLSYVKQNGGPRIQFGLNRWAYLPTCPEFTCLRGSLPQALKKPST